MPEELVNPASPPGLSIQLQRDRANQPDPTFPQSPGIILETNSHNLSTVSACFVLSMNCGHHTAVWKTDNELICTGCSPNRAPEKGGANVPPAIKSSLAQTHLANYSPRLPPHEGRSEQVLSRHSAKILPTP
jgi:hypothetical protein